MLNVEYRTSNQILIALYFRNLTLQCILCINFNIEYFIENTYCTMCLDIMHWGFRAYQIRSDDNRRWSLIDLTYMSNFIPNALNG